jgi:N-carbamoylputrescine amidase
MDFFRRAKPYKGNTTIIRMQQLAKELEVVIPVSFFEEANNAHYNSVAIIDADGTDLGLYRKSHIPDGPGNKCHSSFLFRYRLGYRIF